jgi:hypothetical protein
MVKMRPTKWFELLTLVQQCPATVNGIMVTNCTRLVLWNVALHANGETDTATVKLKSMMREIACTQNTLDEALWKLKLAGLIARKREHENPDTQTGKAACRTLNRELLAKEATRGRAANEAGKR